MDIHTLLEVEEKLKNLNKYEFKGWISNKIHELDKQMTEYYKKERENE